MSKAYLLFMCMVMGAGPARATYSIVACDPDTRACGVAVTTNNLAVGASVCYAEAQVGALVTQFETNPRYGPQGLALLRQGLPPDSVLTRLLAEDGNFEGTGIKARQVALVVPDGGAVVHTGAEVFESPWAGSRRGPHYAIQGNGLVGEEVVVAMERAFLDTQGSLADRLMAALVAGRHAGGQTTGHQSASLLVRTVDGWPFDLDLRVDASSQPVDDLQRLYDWHHARQSIIRAEQHVAQGDLGAAQSHLAMSLHRGARWDRIWRRASRLAMAMGEPQRAVEYLGIFAALNPTWAQIEFGDPIYAELRGRPTFDALRRNH